MQLTDKTKRNLIAAYVNGTIKSKDVSVVEKIVGEDTVYRAYYDRKMQEKDFILQMIPQESLKLNQKSALSNELRMITEELLGKERIPLKDRVKTFLDKPIITIRY